MEHVSTTFQVSSTKTVDFLSDFHHEPKTNRTINCKATLNSLEWKPPYRTPLLLKSSCQYFFFSSGIVWGAKQCSNSSKMTISSKLCELKEQNSRTKDQCKFQLSNTTKPAISIPILLRYFDLFANHMIKTTLRIPISPNKVMTCAFCQSEK